MVEKIKVKQTTDRKQRLFNAQTVMYGHLLYPDNLSIDEQGWIVAEFEANNPQLPHAANALLIMER